MVLSLTEKKYLLNLAHFSIESGFNPKLENYSNNESEVLKEKLGAFVTITINKKLRGCIGYIESEDELSKTIMNAAYNAAFNDPRFDPLSEIEFQKIKLEISVLSKTFTLNSYDEIELGKHGLILEEDGRKSLLLPQVPIEHNMDRDRFLSVLCKKAGFAEDYWENKQLKLQAFTATVFSEEK